MNLPLQFLRETDFIPDPRRRLPRVRGRRAVFLGMDVSVMDGGCQIEYEHQDPRTHQIYLSELGKYGVTLPRLTRLPGTPLPS